MTEHQIAAMQAIFELHEAITEGELSTADLFRVIDAAVDGPVDDLEITLGMVSIAAGKVSQKRAGRLPERERTVLEAGDE